MMQVIYTPTQTTKTKNWVYLNYIPKTTQKVSSIFKSLNINTVATSKMTLRKMLINNKPKIDKNTLSGVYEIQCKECDAIYIGQSGRKFKIRLKEHIKSIETKTITTGFS